MNSIVIEPIWKWHLMYVNKGNSLLILQWEDLSNSCQNPWHLAEVSESLHAFKDKTNSFCLGQLISH